MPTRIIAHPTCSSEVPDARITVYSELATNCASANSVPISVATGKSSYIRDGRWSATKSSAAEIVYPPRPTSPSSWIRSKKAKSMTSAVKMSRIATSTSRPM